SWIALAWQFHSRNQSPTSLTVTQKNLLIYSPLTTGEQDFSMFKYARFTAMAFLYSPIIIILLLHGSSLALFLPLTVIVLQVSLDNLLPKYTRRQTYAHAWFL